MEQEIDCKMQSNSRYVVLRQWEATASCIVAKKKTGLSNRPDIATFFLFLIVLLLACTKVKEWPSASAPADCQQFLNEYFDAWKSKDIATLQALSFYRSSQDRSRLPQCSRDMCS